MVTESCTVASKSFLLAIKARARDVLNDKGFQLPSPPAAAALQAATVLLAWCQDPTNRCDFTLFAETLHSKLQKALDVSFRRGKKKYGGVFTLFVVPVILSKFVQFWKRFLALVSCEAAPIFFQNISDRMFRTAFPVEPISTTVTPSCLTHED